MQSNQSRQHTVDCHSEPVLQPNDGPSFDKAVAQTGLQLEESTSAAESDTLVTEQPLQGWNNRSYFGTWLRNLAANLLPALYLLLSRIWLADLDPAYIALATVFTYVSGATEVINEGIPKVGWGRIGDNVNRSLRERYQLAITLTLTVTILALVLLVVILPVTPSLVDGYHITPDIQAHSYTYIRISSGSVFFAAFINVLSVSTRSLDKPDVPLLVQSVGFVTAIVLDLLITSRFRVMASIPNVNWQAGIKLICDGLSSLVGLAYFVYLVKKCRDTTRLQGDTTSMWPSRRSFLLLVGAGWPFVIEVLPRTAMTLWWSFKSAAISEDIVPALGVFWTMRAGVLWVPLLATEQSCYTFVSHAWAQIAAKRRTGQQLSLRDFRDVAKIIMLSGALVTVIEIVFYIIFSFGPGESFAFYFAEDRNVAELVVLLWRKLDWGFVFVDIYFVASSILIVAAPRWYLAQSLLVSICFNLPVMVAVTVTTVQPSNQWTYLLLTTPVTYMIGLVSCLSFTVVWLTRELRCSNSAHQRLESM